MRARLLALLALTVPGWAAADDDATLRPFANGPGPSAVFRLGRDEARRRDVIGVVDPALWRMQAYALADPDPRAPRPLARRLTKLGDCRLEPSFRVWRVHEVAGRIVLQSQPHVTLAALVHPGARLTFDAMSLPTGRRALAALIARAPTPLEEAPAVACGRIRRFDAARDTAVQVTGGGARPFVLSRGRGRPLVLKDRAFLTSAQELEGAMGARHVLLIARAPAPPGQALSTFTLLRRGPAPAVLRLDFGLARLKTAARPLAVSSRGEVLVLGAPDRQHIVLRACHFGGEVCIAPAPASWPASPPPPVAYAPPARPAPQAELWTWADWYASRRWRVDADALPATCRSVRGCTLPGGLKWQPPAALRLARGVVTLTGVPYAQAMGADGRPAPNARSAFDAAAVIPARAQAGGRERLVGDIENTSVLEQAARVQVLGIDCSALVSILWGLPRVVGTSAFQKGAPRVSAIGALRMGDALLVNRGSALAHMAVFREARPAGPQDASRALLVIESSSACGAVCWTMYDEGAVSGWGLVRRAGD